MHDELFWLKARLPEPRWAPAERELGDPAGRRRMQLVLAGALLDVAARALDDSRHPGAAALLQLPPLTNASGARLAAEVWKRETAAAPLPYGLGSVRRALLEAAEGGMGLSPPAPFGLACLRLSRLGDGVEQRLGRALDAALEDWIAAALAK